MFTAQQPESINLEECEGALNFSSIVHLLLLLLLLLM